MAVTVFRVPGMVFVMVMYVRGLQSYGSTSDGVVYPADPFKFIGETLELYCNITNTHIRENSSSLYFEKLPFSSNKYIQEFLKENFGTITLVPSKNLDILTTKTIRLRIDNVQTSDNGKYICSLKTYHTAQLIGYQIVKVDYRPRKVLNFTCKVFNWESMICTWKLGIGYMHVENINISLVYTYESTRDHPGHGTQNDCPNLTLTSCIWPKEFYHHGHLYYIKVVVSTVNKNIVLASNESEQYRIETQLYEISALIEEDNSTCVQALIQPAPVDRFKAQVINSSCVNLTWDHSAKSREKIYKAYYTSHNKIREILLIDDEVNNYYALVCQLTAFTSYKFQIAVLPQPVQTDLETQGFISEWRYVEANTSEDVPASAPEICSGCFYDVACSQKKSLNDRCIQLIWKDLNASEKRGEITEYKVTTETKSKKKVFNRFHVYMNNHEHLSTAEIYFQEVENSPTEISLTPGTKKGFSEKSSYLIVPSKSKSPKPPNSFLVEKEKLNNDTYHYYISWAALHSSSKMVLKYKSVTVVWCHRALNKKCHKSVHWTVLDADSVTYELTLKVEELLIGISAQIEDGGYTVSSSTTWADCIYLRNKVPLLTPKNVQMSSAHSLLKNSFHIVWQNFQCSEDASYVLEYIIEYCPTFEGLACKGALKKEIVSNQKNEVILKNLKGNTKYKLQIFAVSAAGLSPPSETFVFDVMEAAPESDTTRVIIIVVVLIVLISITSILIWRCISRHNDISNKYGLKNNLGSDKLSVYSALNTSNVSESENKDICRLLPEPMNTADKNHDIKAENGEKDSPLIPDYIKFTSSTLDLHHTKPQTYVASDSGLHCEDTLQIRNCNTEVWNLMLSTQYSHNFNSEKYPKETINSKAFTFTESPLQPDSCRIKMFGNDNDSTNHWYEYSNSVNSHGDYIDFPYVSISELPGSLFSQTVRYQKKLPSSGEFQRKDSQNMILLYPFNNKHTPTCPSYRQHDKLSNNFYCTISKAKHSLPSNVFCPQGKYIESPPLLLSQNLPYCQYQSNDVDHYSTLGLSGPDTQSPSLTYLENSCDDYQSNDVDLYSTQGLSGHDIQSPSLTYLENSCDDYQSNDVDPYSTQGLSGPDTHDLSLTYFENSCDEVDHYSTQGLSGPDTHDLSLTYLENSCDDYQQIPLTSLTVSYSDLKNNMSCVPSHCTSHSSTVTYLNNSSEVFQQQPIIHSDSDHSHPSTLNPSITCLENSSVQHSSFYSDLNPKNHSSTRPLSGILLHLPPRYYVHPDDLCNSSQLLTEL